MRKEVIVEGMKCQGCASGVQEKFSSIEGVQAVDVDLTMKTVMVESTNPISNETLQASLAGTKYQVV